MLNIVINVSKTGKNIRKCMDKRGLNVTEVQNACGLGCPQTVYKWINGQSIPSVDNLGILKVIFETTIDEILVYDNVPVKGSEEHDQTGSYSERLAG